MNEPSNEQSSNRIGGDLAHLRRHTVELGFTVQGGRLDDVQSLIQQNARGLWHCHEPEEGTYETASVALSVMTSNGGETDVSVASSENLDSGELECLRSGMGNWNYESVTPSTFELRINYVWTD